MADTAELRQMVNTFRVSELQVLLGYAGRSKAGRKQEMLSRALALVDKGSSLPVQIKIKDLYKSVRRYPGTGTPAAPNHIPSQHPDINGLKHSDYYNLTASKVPVHPDVRLTKLPFYDQLAELLKPTSLVQAPNNRFQETNFTFHLTPQQAQDISLSRVDQITGPGSKYEYEVQIQLRFILLETSCEQADNFPPSICVRVNNKLATLPNPIQSNKPGVEPRRPSRPVDITVLCRLSPTLPNHIDISWASEYSREFRQPNPHSMLRRTPQPLDITDLAILVKDFTQKVQVTWMDTLTLMPKLDPDTQTKSYCMAVYLVRKLTPDDLLHRLRQTGHRHPDHSRALIKERLAPNSESEITMTSIRVSLTCPLGKMMMRVPCRASTCTHLQCFDADTYLRMNEKKPTWVCPVCDEKTNYANLIIDGLFVCIIKQATDFTDVKFTSDGEWQPVRDCSEAVDLFSSPAPSTVAAVKRPIEQITDLSDTESEPKKLNLDVIDLTEDSDEDSDATISSPYSMNLNPPSNDDSVINIDTPPHAVSPTPPAISYHPPSLTSSVDPPSYRDNTPKSPPPKALPTSHPQPAHQQRPTPSYTSSYTTTYTTTLTTDTSRDHRPAPLMPSLSNYDRFLHPYMMRPTPTTGSNNQLSGNPLSNNPFNYNFLSFLDDPSSSS